MDVNKKLSSRLSIDLSSERVNDSGVNSQYNKMKSELNNSYKPVKKKKSETKEATASGAAGSFVTNLFSKQETKEEWTQKYKDSIDCDNPKGFSQRAHCQGKKKKLKENLTESERTALAKLRDLSKKYACKDTKNCTDKEKIEKAHQELKKQYEMGIKIEKEHKSGDPKQIVIDHLSEDPKYYTKLKKVEANEATGSGSSGSYESPSFLAKSMSPKKWRGASKTQIPGGKFVTVKKKCKKFPYCNQGDINALSLSESKLSKNILSNLSERYGVSESVIKDILLSEFRKNKK
jgi:hypothetical protein